MRFVPAHIFRDFVRNLSDENIRGIVGSRLARHPTIVFIAARDCELRRARRRE